MKRSRRTTGSGQELVRGYLERISSSAFAGFPKQLTDLVGRSHGVYALYHGDSLYYVGLATNLRSRIKSHLRDRHKGKWDHFSLYLVRVEDYVRELESLILRIADPRGNSVRGKLRHAQNLWRDLRSAIQKKQQFDLDEVLGKTKRQQRQARLAGLPNEEEERFVVAKYMTSDWIKLRRTFKGRDYEARVKRDGRISLNGKVFTSPTGAAKSIVGRATNGWKFWQFRNSQGDWVALDTLRK